MSDSLVTLVGAGLLGAVVLGWVAWLTGVGLMRTRATPRALPPPPDTRPAGAVVLTLTFDASAEVEAALRELDTWPMKGGVACLIARTEFLVALRPHLAAARDAKLETWDGLAPEVDAWLDARHRALRAQPADEERLVVHLLLGRVWGSTPLGSLEPVDTLFERLEQWSVLVERMQVVWTTAPRRTPPP